MREPIPQSLLVFLHFGIHLLPEYLFLLFTRLEPPESDPLHTLQLILTLLLYVTVLYY